MSHSFSSHYVEQLREAQKHFHKSTSPFAEADSLLVPAPGGMTVVAQFAHAGQSIDWFMDGAFGSGWEMDFAVSEMRLMEIQSLAEARSIFDKAMDRACTIIGGLSQDALFEKMPANDPILPNEPKIAAILGIIDHTAHHRGALTVYARLLGKPSPMPYAL